MPHFHPVPRTVHWFVVAVKRGLKLLVALSILMLAYQLWNYAFALVEQGEPWMAGFVLLTLGAFVALVVQLVK